MRMAKILAKQGARLGMELREQTDDWEEEMD